MSSWIKRHMPWSLLNTDEEWHAFVIGWAETACPWPARYRITSKAEFTYEKEYHYYLAGRVCGFVTLIVTLLAFSVCLALVVRFI